MTTQRMDLSQAFLDYEKGYLTQAGLLAYYFRIKSAQGETKLTPESIYTDLKIKRSSFYRALAKVKSVEEVTIEYGKVLLPKQGD